MNSGFLLVPSVLVSHGSDLNGDRVDGWREVAVALGELIVFSALQLNSLDMIIIIIIIVDNNTSAIFLFRMKKIDIM